MSINYSTLFGTKLGPLIYTFNSINTFRGTTVPARIATHVADYAGVDASIASSLWTALAAYQGGGGSLQPAIQQLFQQTIIADVGAAISLPDVTLSTVLAALIADMRTNSESVAPNVVGATAAANSGNIGNGIILIGTKTKTGLTLEDAMAETITVLCVADAQSGGVTAGQEQLSFRGQPAAAGGPLGFAWPAGSAGSIVLSSIAPATSQVGGTQNWLANSNFETWTVANVPDNWVIATGTAGTQVLKSTAGGTFYDGTASLSFVGDSSTLTAVTQQFNLAAGSSVVVTPLDQLAWNLYAKTSNTPADGVLEVALVDGSGTIIQDAQGTNNVATVSLATIGTSFVPFGGFFRTPRVLPAVVKLRVRLSTALSTGTTVYIDHLASAEPTALYQGGPYLAPFSASTGLIAGDGYSVAVTNNRAGLFQTGFDQLCDLKSRSMLIPTSGSPTRANSLIA